MQGEIDAEAQCLLSERERGRRVCREVYDAVARQRLEVVGNEIGGEVV